MEPERRSCCVIIVIKRQEAYNCLFKDYTAVLLPVGGTAFFYFMTENSTAATNLP